MPRDEAAAEDTEQPRIGRLDDRVRAASAGCSISKVILRRCLVCRLDAISAEA
jgi:hypothetical protein